MEKEQYLETRKRFDESLKQMRLYWNSQPRHSKGTLDLLLPKQEYDEMIEYEMSHPENDNGSESYGIHSDKRYTIAEYSRKK